MTISEKNIAKFRFCLRPSRSPTYYNLSRFLHEKGWQTTFFNWRSNFNERHFQFDHKAAEALEFKHLLAQLVDQFGIMPETYCINDQNWPSVLKAVANKFYNQNKELSEPIDKIINKPVDNLVWILKPALLNNGKEIKIFQQLSQIEAHYLNKNRLGGDHVLQHYIMRPHLLNGHKYTIRMFLIATNYTGSYIYPKGYFNVALDPYQANEFSDLAPHLTNEHFKEDESNVMQVPIQCYASFKPIYEQILGITRSTMSALQKQHPGAFICQKQRRLAIFGFDFLVDDQLRVWLLEANHGPCFPISDEHSLQKHLYYDFWQAFIDNFVLPIATNQQADLKLAKGPFEQICGHSV